MRKKDFGILAELRKNSRMQYTQLGRITKIPVSTVYEAAEKIREIKKNVAIPYFEKLGFPIRIFLAVQAKDSMSIDLEFFLKKNRNINTLFRTNNDFDFFAEALFKDMEQSQDFLDKIDSLCRTKRVFYITSLIAVEKMLSRKDDSSLL